MQHWMTYVKAAYEVIMIAEGKTSIHLEQDLEAYVVHTFARYMEQPNIPTDTIAIKLMSAMNEKSSQKKKQLEQIAEECILIDGLRLNSRRWPSSSYFSDMGKLALEHRAWIDRPPELFYEKVISNFGNISKLLYSIRA